MSVTTVEDAALAIVQTLVSKYGVTVVSAVLESVIGDPVGLATLASDVTMLIAAILRVVLNTITPEKVRAMLDVQYEAASAVADAMEEEMLGPKDGK